MALDNAFPSGTTPPTQLSTAAQWESYFVAGLGGATGVAQGVGSLFAGSLNSGTRSAVVATGAAMIRGFYVNGGSSVSTSIPAASGQNRIDRLVLRLDRTASAAGSSDPSGCDHRNARLESATSRPRGQPHGFLGSADLSLGIRVQRVADGPRR